MKKGEYLPCVIQARCGEDTTSSSAILIHDGTILTHSTFMLPHCCKRNLSLSQGTLKNIAKFSIMVENEELSLPSGKSVQYQYANSSHGKERDLSVLDAEFIGIFHCREFEEDLLSMMPQTQGWKFSENLGSEDKNLDDTDLISKQIFEEDLYLKSLPVFVALQVYDLKQFTNKFRSFKSMERLNTGTGLFSSRELNIGADLFVLGTPFGDSSPHIFINSLSKGILCNRGTCGALLLTDARCTPGEEGAMVLTERKRTKEGFESHCVGMVVAPLCWKADNLVGLSLVCDILAIVRSLEETFPKFRERFIEQDFLIEVNADPIPSALRHSSVLVKCSGHWGTGILLDSSTVLTCSHVVQKAETVSVFADNAVTTGRIVYRTPPGEPYDLAVIALNMNIPNTDRNLKFASSVTEGEEVFGIGYALFDQSSCKTPSVTRGIVSKVINMDGVAAMIQTDCVVNHGASGGILLKQTGEIVGIIACNCRDIDMKITYPRVNLAIPVMPIMKTIRRYQKSRDPKVLAGLHATSPSIRRLWSMELNHQVKSKL